jgi:hypothetical protein
VSTNYDGTFNDRGFHWSPRTPPARYHVDQIRQRGRWYMDDVATGNFMHKLKRVMSALRPKEKTAIRARHKFPGELCLHQTALNTKPPVA